MSATITAEVFHAIANKCYAFAQFQDTLDAGKAITDTGKVNMNAVRGVITKAKCVDGYSMLEYLCTLLHENPATFNARTDARMTEWGVMLADAIRASGRWDSLVWESPKAAPAPRRGAVPANLLAGLPGLV